MWLGFYGDLVYEATAVKCCKVKLVFPPPLRIFILQRKFSMKFYIETTHQKKPVTALFSEVTLLTLTLHCKACSCTWTSQFKNAFVHMQICTRSMIVWTLDIGVGLYSKNKQHTHKKILTCGASCWSSRIWRRWLGFFSQWQTSLSGWDPHHLCTLKLADKSEVRRQANRGQQTIQVN